MATTNTDTPDTDTLENPTAVPGTLAVGEAIEDWTGDARFYEYSQAADPIGTGAIAPVPTVTFSLVDCAPGCYTLVGDQVDPGTRQIVDPVRIDWEPGEAFVTPPGKWHSHHNESGSAAHLVPIQDAGLQTYLRALDIRFTADSPLRGPLGPDTPLRGPLGPDTPLRGPLGPDTPLRGPG